MSINYTALFILPVTAVILSACSYSGQLTSNQSPTPTVSPVIETETTATGSAAGSDSVDSSLQDLDKTAKQQESTGFEGQLLIDSEVGL